MSEGCELCNIEPNVRYLYWNRVKCRISDLPMYILKRHSATCTPAELSELADVIDYSFAPDAEILWRRCRDTQHMHVYVQPQR